MPLVLPIYGALCAASYTYNQQENRLQCSRERMRVTLAGYASHAF
ncbi:hypothetical protein PUR23_12560 [Methylorubrum populi]